MFGQFQWRRYSSWKGKYIGYFDLSVFVVYLVLLQIMVRDYYSGPRHMPCVILGAEHSTMTSWGKEGEKDAVK